jgi:sec-independent protein translocase protein TatA
MGISIWQLLIILVIVALLFGTKKLRNIGGDLGNAFKSFKSAIDGNDRSAQVDEDPARLPDGRMHQAENAGVREKDAA